MDKILYTLVTEGGGCDGMDFKDKGGKVVMASFSTNAVERKKGMDTRYRIEKSVIDDTEVRREALKKLSKVECLVLGIDDGLY